MITSILFFCLALLMNNLIIAETYDTYDKYFSNWQQTFDQVFRLMNKKYYAPIAKQEIHKAMVRALDAFVQHDPYSRFLYGTDYKEIIDTTQGEFCGIGIFTASHKNDDELLTILDIIPDGPAEKSGLKIGDHIIAINSELLYNTALDESIKKLKGPRYTSVTLTILRDDHLIEVTVTRDIIKEEAVKSYFLSNYFICYIALNSFNTQAPKTLENFLRKALSAPKLNGIILDLRNNSGGLLTAALEILSIFLPKKTTVLSTKDKFDEVIETFETTSTPLNFGNTPIFIIINSLTASSAEIIAGTLQLFSEQAIVFKNNIPFCFTIGTKTFGKSTVQEVIQLDAQSALKLTTGKYYLANNRSIPETGLIPEFIVETRPHILCQKQKIEALLKKSKNSKTKAEESLKNDYQLQQTIQLISLFNIAKNCCPKEIKSHQKTVSFLNAHFISHTELQIEEM